MTIHLGPALVFAHQSILTCPEFLEEVGHTHTHYHAVSEKNSSLLPCNVTIIIQNENHENYNPYYKVLYYMCICIKSTFLGAYRNNKLVRLGW